MARYEYTCRNPHCIQMSLAIEIEKPMADYDKPERCGSCPEPLTKLPPSKTGFTLKGTGWHSSDYPKTR